MQRKDVERVKAEVLTREDEYGEAWVLASDYAELLDRAERAEAELSDLRNGWVNSVKAHADALAERDALDAIASKLQHDHDMMALANGKLEAERDAAFAAGQDAERERCWTLAMDAHEVWWRRGVATAYEPLRELADKIGCPAKPHP